MNYRNLFLLAAGSVLLFTGLGSPQLIDWDENIYAIVTRNIIRSGDYLHLTWNDQVFYEKPPLFFWIQSVFFNMFGVSEFSARMISAFSGIAVMVMLWSAGKKIAGPSFGLILSAVYFGSFIPVLLARMAIIDYLFNTFIAAAVISLYFFDSERLRRLSSKTGLFSIYIKLSKEEFYWLLAGAVSMGLAVLTKGPLGGVIPLSAYISLKIFRTRPLPSLTDTLILGTVSLSIAVSYFAVMYIADGGRYLAGFAEFQNRLLSTPLDSHDGPFFYHVIILIIGFLPWTAVLLLYKGKDFRKSLFESYAPAADAPFRDFRSIAGMSLGWILFVLILFGIVKTKLPHYSASMYFPLSFLASMALFHLKQEQETLPRKVRWSTLGFGIFLGVFLSVIPFVMEYIRAEADFVIDSPFHPSVFAAMPGILLAAASVILVVYSSRKQYINAVVMAAGTMGLFAVSSWLFLMPLNEYYNQRPRLELMRHAYSEGGRLVLYKDISFAVMFYGDKTVDVLYNYKFEGDPALLNRRHSEDYFILTRTASEKDLETNHPLAERVRRLGNHSLYVIRSGN